MKIANEIHLKYVDDLTLGEAINLPEKLVTVPVNQRPQLSCQDRACPATQEQQGIQPVEEN